MYSLLRVMHSFPLFFINAQSDGGHAGMVQKEFISKKNAEESKTKLLHTLRAHAKGGCAFFGPLKRKRRSLAQIPPPNLSIQKQNLTTTVVVRFTDRKEQSPTFAITHLLQTPTFASIHFCNQAIIRPAISSPTTAESATPMPLIRTAHQTPGAADCRIGFFSLPMPMMPLQRSVMV